MCGRGRGVVVIVVVIIIIIVVVVVVVAVVAFRLRFASPARWRIVAYLSTYKATVTARTLFRALDFGDKATVTRCP